MRDGLKDGLKEDFRDGFKDEVKDEWMDLVIDLGMSSGMDLGIDSPIQGTLQRIDSEAVACFQNRCMFSELNSTDAAWIQRCIGAFICTFPMDLEWLHASRHILAHAWLWDVFTDDAHSDS